MGSADVRVALPCEYISPAPWTAMVCRTSDITSCVCVSYTLQIKRFVGIEVGKYRELSPRENKIRLNLDPPKSFLRVASSIVVESGIIFL